VWRFDRFARSVKHLVAALETFRTLQVGFISLQEQLDTATPIGQAMFTIIGAMAQLERDIIRERVKAGLEHARSRGVRLGRPPAMTPEQVRHARDLLARPTNTVSSIARLLGVSRSTIYKYAPELGGRTGDAAPALDVVLAALPEDTRPPPDVTEYDNLLPSRRMPSGGR